MNSQRMILGAPSPLPKNQPKSRISISLLCKTWEGLGAAIIFGLSISSFFTLFVIPALFATFIKEEK